MPTNLINQLLGDLRGDTLNSVSSALGESPAKTQSALGAAVPAVVGGLANKVNTAGDANALLDLIKGNHLDAGPYTDAASAVKGPSGLSGLIDTGRPLLDSVFGSRTGSVADWVSSLGGISRTSASSLLGLTVPLVLGQVGRQVKSAGWNAANLMSLLAGQRSFLQEAPAGLAGILSGDEVAARRVGTYEAATPNYERARAVGTYQAAPRRRASWLWLLPLLLLIPLIGWLLNRRADLVKQTVTTAPRVEVPATPQPRPETPIAPAATVPSAAALGPFIEMKLPNDVSIRIPSNGVESKLITFIQDPARPVGADNWFSFDRLQFDTDSARLTPASSEQLRNISEIMKAYPQVKIKIGGYTDNQADAAYNMKLSQERATNTVNELVTLGTDPSRVEAEGFGATHPVADNATPEGRQRNRRVDILVTNK
ncbi:MAG TPA: OmpA family protein [Vicinamibacterales bacterium]|nr:OmpA family protein [Vicinamibacterales bacterium]